MLQKGLGRSAEQNRGLGGDIRLKSGPYLVLFVLLHSGRPGSGRPMLWSSSTDGSSVSRRRPGKARMNKKVSSLPFRPLKYLPTYLQKCNTRSQYVYVRSYTLHRWNLHHPRIIQLRRNLRPTIYHHQYMLRFNNTPANTITLAHPVRSGINTHM